MGFFSFFFGTGNSSGFLSKQEKYLSKQEIKKLVSKVKVRSLTTGEEQLVEQIVDQRRRGDGKISLFQIDEVLRKLKNKNQISDTDRKGLIRVFKEYFFKHK